MMINRDPKPKKKKSLRKDQSLKIYTKDVIHVMSQKGSGFNVNSISQALPHMSKRRVSDVFTTLRGAGLLSEYGRTPSVWGKGKHNGRVVYQYHGKQGVEELCKKMMENKGMVCPYPEFKQLLCCGWKLIQCLSQQTVWKLSALTKAIFGTEKSRRMYDLVLVFHSAGLIYAPPKCVYYQSLLFRQTEEEEQVEEEQVEEEQVEEEEFRQDLTISNESAIEIWPDLAPHLWTNKDGSFVF
jgi:hypothetical protein